MICLCKSFHAISIHALREEGDSSGMDEKSHLNGFLSTPSARRATQERDDFAMVIEISIHALREEGDSKNREKTSAFVPL